MPPTPKKSPKKSAKGKAKGKGKKKGKKKGSQVGKPWIGFAVKNSKGKPTILVKDVAEGGPAEKAGLIDGDELVSVNKKPVPTLQAFRAAIAGIKAKKKLKIVVLRDAGGVDNAIKKTFTVTVVSKQKEIIDFPPLRSLEDLQLLIMDPHMMHRASLACFAELDSDLSGLVTREEFMTGLKQWLPPQLTKDLSESEMKLIFDTVDVDNSGYLVRSEFPPVLELVFRSILSLTLTPIIGFNVHKPRGTSALYVKVVWAGGPAERAGLLPNDEIATFNGIQVPSLKAFRNIARNLQVGQVCRLEVLRADPYTQAPTYHTLHLVVEGREKNILLPPMKTAQDLEAILQDPAKFQIVALSAFLSADKDLCGLLDKQEFVVSMREWLIQWGGKWLSDLISDNDLYSLFERADIDGAGFLDQEEFNPVVEGLLRCLAAGMAAAVTAASQLLASVSGGGRPWLGFEAHKVKGKRNIYVADVAEEGPADKAGLQDGDEIVSVGGTFTPDMNGFKDALQRLRVGQVVRVELNRNMDGSYETLRHDIIVGCRKKKIVSNVPPARTVAEIEAVLADSYKLERLATAYFVEADEDFGGLVDFSEFKAVMRHYMPPEISKAVKDSDLEQLFQAIDIDRSGYLAKSEFQTAVEGVLRLQVGFMKGTIKSVSEVIAMLMSVAPPKEGSPWLGFQAHICKGKTGVMVQEVAEDGPADKAGLTDGDQLVSVAGEQIKDMDSFRHSIRDIQVGQNIKIVILRGKACTTVDLTVGARKRKTVSNVPPMNTLKDIEAILEDSFKLDRLSASIFYEADDDFSGLVDVKEFKKVMRRRIPAELSKMLKDSDLEQLFDMVDRDHSGFLSRSEFQPVVEGVLKLMIGLQKGTIKTVQELIAILNSVAPPKEGSPWLGFEAQLISGASNISVKDVVEDGPADTAGLLNGDIIVSMANIPMTEMRIFREFTKTIEVNQIIKVQLMREGGYKATDLKVGARKKKIITNVPRMSSVEDMEAILKDPNKLQRITAAVFADADIDFSGLIDSREFRTALRQRLPPQISRMVQDADLNYLFDSVDKDKSGFLGQNEFTKVMEAVLHTLIGFSRGTIRSVEEVVMKLTGAPPQKEGLPWLGFDVRLGGDKKTVFITGVTEDGPADKVGILDGDQLFSISGKTIHDLTTFRTIVKTLTVGKPVQVVVLRGGNCVTLELIVGAKKRKQIANVPPMETVQDLQDILADSFKLSTLATSFFNEADDDCSGMIDRNEFLGAMQNWLPTSLQRLLRESDLTALFNMVDVDRSGLLSKSEFPPVIEGLVRLLLGFLTGTINDVSQVVALLTSAAPPEQGTPWIGIVAKDHPKIKGIKVQDLAEGGPADKAGILVGDYITSIANQPVPDASTYLKVLRDLQVGKTVEAQVGHEGDKAPKRISITVGAREFKPVANVPPTSTTADLEALLLDHTKLERLALAIFTDADKDFSGLVDAKEFKTALRSFLPAEFSNVLKDHDLDALFRQVDDDHSGYLTKTEFTPLVEGLVKSLIKYHYSGVADASALAGEVSNGRPWLGMEVKPAEGRPAIIVQDVSPNGPAAKAGVRPLDEIVTLDGKRTPRVDTFIKTVRGLSVGQVIKVELLRDSSSSNTSDAEVYRRFNLIVGFKQKEVVSDVPRMESVQDLKAILNDSYKLERAAASAFVSADDDMSGLVDEGEFASAIKRWLHQWGGKKLSDLLTEAELLDLFHRVDVDKSHYLSRSEFLPVMEGLLQMIIEASEGKQSKDALLNSAPPEVGSAWLGMEVKNGHGAVTVVEVVPSGPANKAGVAAGDDILSISNHAVPDISAFRTVLRTLTVGQTVSFQVRRHGSVSTKNITVAPRVKEIVKDVPPMHTAEDIYRLIRDPHLLQTVMAYLWSETDTDFSGLVSCREFILSLRRIMPPALSALFTDAELEQRFRELDVDGSGFLKRTEFCVMVEGLLAMLAKHAPSANRALEFVPHPDAYKLRLGIHEAFPWSVDGAQRVRVEITVGDQRYTTGSGRRGQHGIIWAEECVIWVLGSDVAEIALFNEDTGVVMTKAPVRGSTLTHMLGTKFWTPLPNLGGSQLLLSVEGEGSLSGMSSPHSRVRRVVVVGAPVAATKAEPVVVTVPAPSVSLQHSAIVVRSVASTSTMVPNAPSSVLRVASPQRVEHLHEVPASPPPVQVRLAAAPAYSPTHEYSPPKAYYRVPAATVTYE